MFVRKHKILEVRHRRRIGGGNPTYQAFVTLQPDSGLFNSLGTGVIKLTEKKWLKQNKLIVYLSYFIQSAPIYNTRML